MAVVVGNYCKRGPGERGLAKANIYYIQTRPGRDKQRQSRVLFGPGGPMSRYEANEFIKAAPKGTYFYRLKLSPDPLLEDGKRDLNMQKLTRAIMKRLEKRLKTQIPWAAALHDDHTDIRHVHILAAIPKRLNRYELEFLIREATYLALSQRRFLDRGVTRLPWQEHTPAQTLQAGKYTAYRAHQGAFSPPAGGARIRYTSCMCPRCHMLQTHRKHQGMHQCPSCGLMLHKKKEMSRKKMFKGRGLERSL
jgi:hypothetical protein